MLTIEQEAEVLKISKYCEIITQIIDIHKVLSVIKLLVYSYIVKNCKIDLFDCRTSTELVYRSISLMTGNFDIFLNEIPVILKSIHILFASKKINIEDSIVKPINTIYAINRLYDIDSFIYKAINESKKMSDRQFLKEVISNV